MLVLQRHIFEEIVINSPNGDQIVVALVKVLGNKARIGVTAPREYEINRGEVQCRIDEPDSRSLIQAGLEDVADLGRRVIDPLGVADAYEEELSLK